MQTEKLLNAVISISTSGSNEIIAAPSSGYIVIEHINLIPTAASDVTFLSGTTELSGAYPFDAKQALVLENTYNDEDGIMKCANEEAFNITLGTATQTSGFVKYRIKGL